MSERVDLREFLSGFLAEAGEHLRAIHANLLVVDGALQRGEAAPRPVRDLFRSLHTIKGLAGMVGVEPIVELTHAMESVLRASERAGGRLPAGAFEPLLEGTHAIGQRVRALGEGTTVAPIPEALLERLAALEAASPRTGGRTGTIVALDPALDAKLATAEREQIASALAAGRRVVEVSFTPSAQRAAEGLTITTVRGRIAELAEIVKVVPISTSGGGASPGLRFLLLVVTSHEPGALAEAAGLTPADARSLDLEPPTEDPVDFDDRHGIAETGIVRVAVARVDDALDGLSALLVTRMRLAREIDRQAATGADVRELRRVAHDITRQLADMRRAVVGLRMLAVTELLEPLPLLVRGLRASTGKDVGVVIDAGHVEVDKAVAERLWPAVVHLVRNAIDHGIEDPDRRRVAGKPERGVVTVRSVQIGSGRVELSIEDDGRGIDRARVAAKARRPVPTTDAELLDLVTTPGLSTRDRADATSGRGMGLDIVRRAVEELGGELTLSSTPGQGTRFTLRAPVTVAIIDAVAFECAAQTFLVPVSSVDELVEIRGEELIGSPAPRRTSARTRILPLRGVAVPFVELAEALGLGAVDVTSGKAIVVRREDKLLAFGIERLLGHHAVVVRPLRDPLVTVRGVTGSTDLGDGRPTLILDLHALTPQTSLDPKGHEGRAA